MRHVHGPNHAPAHTCKNGPASMGQPQRHQQPAWAATATAAVAPTSEELVCHLLHCARVAKGHARVAAACCSRCSCTCRQACLARQLQVLRQVPAPAPCQHRPQPYLLLSLQEVCLSGGEDLHVPGGQEGRGQGGEGRVVRRGWGWEGGGLTCLLSTATDVHCTCCACILQSSSESQHMLEALSLCCTIKLHLDADCAVLPCMHRMQQLRAAQPGQPAQPAPGLWQAVC